LRKESQDFCELLKGDPEIARQEIQKRIKKLVMTQRNSNGAVLEVSGDIELLRTGDLLDESPLDGIARPYTLPRIAIADVVLDPSLHVAV